jgi:small subunit ribosomal protein S1
VLDIDRERQRISLGLKQTQSDPWQQVLDHYQQGDVVEGRVTKVVTFGAFVEILPGVEGLVHISELAQHHVENPREIVSQGDPVNVLILEIDGDRRRLSLSLKRVEEGTQPVPRADGGESVHTMPDLRLSEEAFPSGAAVEEELPAVEEELAAVEEELAAVEEELAAVEEELATVEEVELEESAELAAVADTVEEVESDVVVEEVETAVVADAAEEPEQATEEVVDDLEQPEDEPA